jgi:hypothetical protein
MLDGYPPRTFHTKRLKVRPQDFGSAELGNQHGEGLDMLKCFEGGNV